MSLSRHRILAGTVLLLLAACGEPIVGTSRPARPTEFARSVLQGEPITLQEDSPRSVLILTDVSDGEAFDAAEITVEVDGEGEAPVNADSFSFERDMRDVTLTITPLPDLHGEVAAVVRVDGGDTRQLEVDLTVIVEPVNDAPTIADIDDQVSDDGSVLGDIAIAVDDIDNDAEDLEVSASVEDQELASAEVEGTGEMRTLTITPSQGVDGVTEVTVTVDDGQDSASTTFALTVGEGDMPVDDPPSISDIADPDDIAEDSSTPALAFTVADPDTELESLTISVASSDQAVVADAGLALGGSAGDRTLTVTPVADAHGTATITVEVSDGTTTVSTEFVVTVTPVDDPPVFVLEVTDQTTAEDTPLGPLSFEVSDVDTDAESLVISAASDGGPIGSAGVETTSGTASPTVTLTPSANQSGTSGITLSVSDGTTTVTSEFSVTVSEVDDPPQFMSTVPDQAVDEDNPTAALVFAVVDIDSAPPELVLTAASDGGPVDASGVAISALVQDSGGIAMPTVTVTPLPDQHGTSTITLSLTDGTSTVTDEFEVSVAAQNDPPVVEVGVADAATGEDSDSDALSLTILDVDSSPPDLALGTVTCDDPCGSLSFSAISQDADGRAMPTVTVTPVPNASGVTDVTYSLTDGDVTVMDTFQFTVNTLDDPPAITAIPMDQTIAEDADTGALALEIVDVDSAPPDLALSATSSGGPVSNGGIVFSSISQAPDGTATPTVTVTPDPDQTGTSTITVSLTDGVTTVHDSFDVTVTEDNDPPVIEVGVADTTVDEDTDTMALPLTILDIDSAPPDLALSTTTCNSPCQSLSFSSISQDASGRATPTVTVTPVPGASGMTTVAYSLTDGSDTVGDSFALTVDPVNDRPTIGTIPGQTTNEDIASVPVAFSVDDVDDDNCTLVLSVTGSTDPSLADASSTTIDQTDCDNPTISVTPKANQFGSVTLTVDVSDGDLSASTSFALMVNAQNDSPTISTVADQTIDEDGSTGVLAFTVDDVETAAGSLSVTATSDNPALVPNSPSNLVLGGSGTSRSVDVVPAANQSGTANITLEVSDGSDSTPETFQVTVDAVDDPPTITVAIVDQTIDENNSTAALAFTVNDIDTALSSLTVSGASTNTGLLPEPGAYSFGGSDGNRTVTLTPAANQFGAATVTLSVADGTTTVPAGATFGITVNNTNDPPVAGDDAYTGASGTTGNTSRAFASVLGNDTDDGPTVALTATAVTGGATTEGGSFDMATDGTFTYYPPPGFIGNDTFDYTVNDNDAGGNQADTGTVTVETTAPMVWYVDNTAAGGGDGRSHLPFNTLAAVESVTTATASDQVSLAYGDGTSTGQNAGLTLQAGMDLIGVPNGSSQLPVITNSSGDGITLASNCTVQNVEVRAPTGAGIVGSGVGGDTVISSVELTNTGNDGLRVTASLAGATLALSDVTISTTDGDGIQIDNGGTLSATGVVTVSATDGMGVDLQNSAIDNTDGFGVDSITVNNSAGNGLRINGNSGGVISLADASIVNTGGSGVLISSNTATVNLTGATNTVSTTSGPALTASSSTLGLTFLSLSSNGGDNGIDLDTTTGSVTVSGDGGGTANASGGTLQAHTKANVELQNAAGVSLSSVLLLNAADDGLLASGSTGLSLIDSEIRSAGDGTADHAVELSNVTGSMLFDTVEIDTTVGDAFLLTQASGTLPSLIVRDCDFHDASMGGIMKLAISGASVLTDVQVLSTTLTNTTGNGFLATVEGTSNTTLTLTGVDVLNADVSGIELYMTTGTPSLFFSVADGSVDLDGNTSGYGIRARTEASGTLRGTISGNTIGSGVGSADAGRAGIHTNMLAPTDAIIEILNNTILDHLDAGIYLTTFGATGASTTFDYYLEGNDTSGADAFSLAGYHIEGTNSMTNCVRFVSNDSDLPGFGFGYSFDAFTSGSNRVHNYAGSAQTTLSGEGNTTNGGMPSVFEYVGASNGTCRRL
ncbi:MAG: tandem-95 repeat protein [Myxococcales bacterium]|nr:tandem-95 repeat protein [Myxococcales bacterium]